MAINDITDAEIREYLLGSAAPEAAERLDELSFTDEYAERLGAVENDLIDEYLSGDLPAAEAHAFGSHLLSSPRRREKLNFARAFASYAHRSRPVAAGEAEPRGSIFDGFRNWRLVFQFGVAAAGLLLVAIVGLLVYRSGNEAGNGPVVATDLGSPTPANPGIAPIPEPSPAATPSQDTSIPARPEVADAPAYPKPRPTPAQPKRQRPSLAVFTLTPALRSTTFQSVRPTAGPAEFRLRLETEANGPFTAEIVELRGQARIWAARSVAASGRDDARTVTFRVPPGTVRAGEHRVTLFARGQNGQQEKVGDYFFRVAP